MLAPTDPSQLPAPGGENTDQQRAVTRLALDIPRVFADPSPLCATEATGLMCVAFAGRSNDREDKANNQALRCETRGLWHVSRGGIRSTLLSLAPALRRARARPLPR